MEIKHTQVPVVTINVKTVKALTFSDKKGGEYAITVPAGEGCEQLTTMLRDMAEKGLSVTGYDVRHAGYIMQLSELGDPAKPTRRKNDLSLPESIGDYSYMVASVGCADGGILANNIMHDCLTCQSYACKTADGAIALAKNLAVDNPDMEIYVYRISEGVRYKLFSVRKIDEHRTNETSTDKKHDPGLEQSS